MCTRFFSLLLFSFATAALIRRSANCCANVILDFFEYYKCVDIRTNERKSQEKIRTEIAANARRVSAWDALKVQTNSGINTAYTFIFDAI